MKLSNRSFPHPVVGNADDVPGAEFQAALEFASDETNFYLTATVRCSSKTLNRMIAKGTACYALHVECGNTLYRRTIDFTTATHRETIPAADIHAAVEVVPFVRATKDASGYTIDGANADYADATFEVRHGDILAVGDGQVFEADHPVDPLRLVGALMDIRQSPRPGDHPMEANFDDDKIHIELCEADFVAYRELKAVGTMADLLTTTLVLPVLMEALSELARGEDIEDRKWARLLRQRLSTPELKSATTDLEKAQRLLDSPIRRALASGRASAPPAE